MKKFAATFKSITILVVLIVSVFFVFLRKIDATVPYVSDTNYGNACYYPYIWDSTLQTNVLLPPSQVPQQNEATYQHYLANGNKKYYGRLFLLTNPALTFTPYAANYTIIDGNWNKDDPNATGTYQNIFNCGVPMQMSIDPGQIEVSNGSPISPFLTGPGTINSVITDNNGSSFNWIIPTSTGNGQSGTITYSSTPLGGTSPVCNWSFDFVVSCTSDLQVTKSPITSKDEMYVGNNATFQFDVQNNGVGLATKPVTLSDTIPAGLSYASYSVTNNTIPNSQVVCTNLSQNFTCTLKDLSGNDMDFPAPVVTTTGNTTTSTPYTFSVQLVTKINSVISTNNTATVSQDSNGSDTDLGNNSSTIPVVTLPIDLGISKSQLTNQSEMFVGNQASFRITVHNNSTYGSAALPITITDTLPAGLVYSSISNNPNGLTCSNSGQTVTCVSNTDLAANSDLSFDVTVNITQVIPSSPIVYNLATVTSNSPEPTPDTIHPNNTNLQVITFNPVSDLSIEKTLSSGALVVGNNVTYNLAIKNSGPQNSTNPTVSDTLPLGYKYLSFSGTNYSCLASAYSPTTQQVVTCQKTGSINSGATDNIQITVHINPEAFWSSQNPSVNNACVSAVLPNVDNNSDNNCSDIPTNTQNRANISVTKTIDGNPSTITPGGGISYTITLTNTGPGADNNIQFSDPLSSYLTSVTASCTIQTPGSSTDASWSETCGSPNVSTSSVTATAALKVGGVAVYHIFATIDPSLNSNSCPYVPNVANGTPVSGTAGSGNANIQIIPSHNLVITNSSLQPNPLVAGQSFNFSLNIQNTGSTFTNGTAKINLVDKNGIPNTDVSNLTSVCNPMVGIGLCGGLTYTYDATNNGTTTFGVGTNISTLQMSNASTMQIATTGNLNSQQTFDSLYYTAQVSLPTCNNTVVNKCFDCTTNSLIDVPVGGCPICQPQNCINNNCVQSAADLGLTKVASKTSVTAGQTLDYTLNLTNYGPSISNAPITITDTLPQELDLVSGTWYTSADFNCGYNATTRLITCTKLTNMAVNAVSTITLKTIVKSDTKSIKLTNEAIAKGTTQECAIPVGQTTCTDTHLNKGTVTTDIVRSADIAVFKTHDGSSQTGGVGIFKLNVKNLGPSTAQEVIVNDLVPSSLDITSVIAPINWTCIQNANNIQNTVSCSYSLDLPVNYSDTIIIAYKIHDNAVGQIINTVNITGKDPDPDKNNNTSSDSLNVERKADLSIVKSHTGGTKYGDTGKFTLSISNTGPSTAKAVVVTDKIPSGIEIAGILAPQDWICINSSGTISCSYSLEMKVGYTGQIEINYEITQKSSGKIINTAVIKSNDDDPDNTNNTSTDTLNISELPKTNVEDNSKIVVIFLSISLLTITYFIYLSLLSNKAEISFEDKF